MVEGRTPTGCKNGQKLLSRGSKKEHVWVMLGVSVFPPLHRANGHDVPKRYSEGTPPISPRPRFAELSRRPGSAETARAKRVRRAAPVFWSCSKAMAFVSLNLQGGGGALWKGTCTWARRSCILTYDMTGNTVGNTICGSKCCSSSSRGIQLLRQDQSIGWTTLHGALAIQALKSQTWQPSQSWALTL